jgi:hypothetical protein
VISACFDNIGEVVIEFANPPEPTSALDEETMKKVENTLLSLLPSRVSLEPIPEVMWICTDPIGKWQDEQRWGWAQGVFVDHT